MRPCLTGCDWCGCCRLETTRLKRACMSLYVEGTPRLLMINKEHSGMVPTITFWINTRQQLQMSNPPPSPWLDAASVAMSGHTRCRPPQQHCLRAPQVSAKRHMQGISLLWNPVQPALLSDSCQPSHERALHRAVQPAALHPLVCCTLQHHQAACC